jgi:hypothetical protein
MHAKVDSYLFNNGNSFIVVRLRLRIVEWSILRVECLRKPIFQLLNQNEISEGKLKIPGGLQLRQP